MTIIRTRDVLSTSSALSVYRRTRNQCIKMCTARKIRKKKIASDDYHASIYYATNKARIIAANRSRGLPVGANADTRERILYFRRETSRTRVRLSAARRYVYAVCRQNNSSPILLASHTRTERRIERKRKKKQFLQYSDHARTWDFKVRRAYDGVGDLQGVVGTRHNVMPSTRRY